VCMWYAVSVCLSLVYCCIMRNKLYINKLFNTSAANSMASVISDRHECTTWRTRRIWDRWSRSVRVSLSRCAKRLNGLRSRSGWRFSALKVHFVRGKRKGEDADTQYSASSVKCGTQFCLHIHALAPSFAATKRGVEENFVCCKGKGKGKGKGHLI